MLFKIILPLLYKDEIMKNLLLASTSTVHGKPYLSYLFEVLQEHFKGVNEILFVPFARPGGITHDEYTAIAHKAFAEIGIGVKGVHESKDMKEAVRQAEGIFIGGGNSFVLLHDLYKYAMLSLIKEQVENGTPYFGTSAGSNIAGPTIMNTNDMPIIYPPSFNAMGLIPFNINPHFLDPDPNSTHMGETRETRIIEYQHFNTTPVIGIREGSWIEVKGDTYILRGTLTARWFVTGKETVELPTGTKIEV